MKKAKYRCGNQYMPQWLQKLLSTRFNASCRVHDWDYEPTSKFTRKESDKRFLNNMLKQAESRNSKFDKVVAYVYYPIVRLLGFITHGKHDKTL